MVQDWYIDNDARISLEPHIKLVVNTTNWKLSLQQTESFFFLSKYIIIAYYCPIILTDIIFDFPVWALLASFSTKYPAIFSYRGIVSPFSSTCHLNKFSMDIIQFRDSIFFLCLHLFVVLHIIITSYAPILIASLLNSRKILNSSISFFISETNRFI